MVGRIVVGSPGVGARPFEWPVPGHPEWLAVTPEAQRAFPSVEDILLRKAVRPSRSVSTPRLLGLACTVPPPCHRPEHDPRRGTRHLRTPAP
ncbi:MAG: hypothetical protein WCF85_16430 [Rhodospirillaceae bacterium]